MKVPSLGPPWPSIQWIQDDPSLVLNDWPSIVNGKSKNGYHSELMLNPPSSNDMFAGQMGFFDQTKMLVYLRRVASTVTI